MSCSSALEMSVILVFKELPDQQWSDEFLAAKVAQGDVTALEYLYDRHAALILGMVLKITGDQAKAENVLQDTFWHVWKNADTYQRQDGKFKAWLFRMARSLAMDACRRQR